MLINDAAGPRTPFLESTPREWAYAIEVNLFGVAFCCHRVLRSMLALGYARSINLVSFAGLYPGLGSSAYSVSKAALRSVTKTVAH